MGRLSVLLIMCTIAILFFVTHGYFADNRQLSCLKMVYKDADFNVDDSGTSDVLENSIHGFYDANETLVHLKTNDVYNTTEVGAKDQTMWIQSSCQDGCVATKLTYACCVTLPKVDYLVCLNVTYLPQNYGFNFTLRLGDRIFWREVSLRNPPPLCIDAEFLPDKMASLCMAVTDITPTSSNIHFCLELILEVYYKDIITQHLGCVDIPLALVGREVQESVQYMLAGSRTGK